MILNRYLITVSYDGSKFYGFQRLKDQNTVQKRIEDALSKINKSPVVIKGAGRTDRGVHAMRQRCHFDLNIKIDAGRLKTAIDNAVGEYISIKECKKVDLDFHARFCVKRKEYLYKINIGEYEPTLEDYTLQINYKLNMTKMRECAKVFVGEHNFASFVCGKRDNYNGTIYSIKIKKIDNMIYINFVGKSFYQYMVRNLVGAILEVGKGKAEVIEIKKMLDSEEENVVIPTVKPNGLYLIDIEY